MTQPEWTRRSPLGDWAHWGFGKAEEHGRPSSIRLSAMNSAPRRIKGNSHRALLAKSSGGSIAEDEGGGEKREEREKARVGRRDGGVGASSASLLRSVHAKTINGCDKHSSGDSTKSK